MSGLKNMTVEGWQKCGCGLCIRGRGIAEVLNRTLDHCNCTYEDSQIVIRTAK